VGRPLQGSAHGRDKISTVEASPDRLAMIIERRLGYETNERFLLSVTILAKYWPQWT
jgi:hypothetical protein